MMEILSFNTYSSLETLRSERYENHEEKHPDEEWKTTIELKIKGLEKNDLGEYTCSATSSMGKAEATLRVYGREKGNLNQTEKKKKLFLNR